MSTLGHWRAAGATGAAAAELALEGDKRPKPYRKSVARIFRTLLDLQSCVEVIVKKIEIIAEFIFSQGIFRPVHQLYCSRKSFVPTGASGHLNMRSQFDIALCRPSVSRSAAWLLACRRVGSVDTSVVYTR